MNRTGLLVAAAAAALALAAATCSDGGSATDTSAGTGGRAPESGSTSGHGGSVGHSGSTGHGGSAAQGGASSSGAGASGGGTCDGGPCDMPPLGLLNPDYTTAWNPGILSDTATGAALGPDGLPVRATVCAMVPATGGDATAAIQSALDGCEGMNQVVALAAATYSVSATIQVPSGVVLRGAGSDGATGTTLVEHGGWARPRDRHRARPGLLRRELRPRGQAAAHRRRDQGDGDGHRRGRVRLHAGRPRAPRRSGRRRGERG